MRSLAVAVFLVLVAGASSTRAAAPVAWTIADNFATRNPLTTTTDGPINTRISATALARALSHLGYDAHAALHGMRAGTLVGAQRTAAVFAVFGHAAGGAIATKFDHPGPGYMDYDFLTAARPVYRGKIARWEQEHMASWQGLPQWGLDAMRVAIFGGCNTADDGGRAGTGNFLVWGPWLGIDAVVGFRGLTYSSVHNVNYAGNYFWSRFSKWIAGGGTLSGALSRARADIVKHEGRDFGWGAWAIAGASAHPDAIRLRPAGYGERNGPAAAVTVRDPAGHITTLIRPATRTGPLRISADAARAAAARALRSTGLTGLHLVSSSAASHVAGEALLELQYRSLVDGLPGPAIADVEVDRRTGSVVFEAAGGVRSRTTRFAIGRAQAQSVARRAAPKGWTVVATRRDIWTAPRWTVTLAPPHGAPARFEVDVDGSTGRVMQLLST